MKITSTGVTDPGRTRKNNEDAFIANDTLGLYAVADGVGGLQAGEVASRMMVEVLTGVIAGLRSGKDETPSFGISRSERHEVTALRHAVHLANRKIGEAAGRDSRLNGMGTTVTAMVLLEGAAYIAHVGDSRAYRLQDGTLEQLTADHSLVAEQVRAGKLTLQQARRSSNRNIITRAVGIAPDVEVDVTAVPVHPGDRFLLCTDGLTDMVPDAEIADILRRAGPGEAAQALVREANDRGGKDNITAVVVDMEST